jgi:hypothetical protein
MLRRGWHVQRLQDLPAQGSVVTVKLRMSRWRGLVALLNQDRENAARPEISSCRDNLAPRAHRHGAKLAICSS